jgi:phage terminase large subunit-like protein
MLDLVAVDRSAWSTAVPDWKARVRAGESLIPALPLHRARAAKALAIFKALRVPDIEGNPTYGEVCEPFVFDLVRSIFGAFDADGARRMVREFFLLIPKKNGKTSIAAAIIVVAAILNERPQSELLLIAPTINIAERSFKQARGIIQLTVMPSGVALSDLFSVHEHIRTIRNLNPEMPSEIVVKAADSDVVTGSKASVILVDELHEFASKPRADGVLVEIRGGLSHPQNKGFLLQITTQSKTPPKGVFKAELKRARDVRDGLLDLPLLPLLYELPPEDARDDGWKRPQTWPWVNPHLGRSVSADFLADQLRAAEDQGPEALALLASQHFNFEIGQSLSGDGWSGAPHWARRARPGMTLEQILDECEVVTIGADWGGADDLAALAVIGRRAKDKMWLHWCRAWARPSVLESRKSLVSVLRDFERDGDLVIAPDPEEQALDAARVCAEIHASGLLPEENGIGLDTAGVALLMDALEARDMVQPLVTGVSQGWQLQRAISTVPLKLEAGRLLHAGQPIMGWAVGNAKQELRGNTWYVSKQASGVAKIDPLMATFNAAMLMLLNPVAARSSAYEYAGM